MYIGKFVSLEVDSMDKPSEIITISDRDIISAIQENGWYIDKVEKTPERCLEAVKQDGRTLKSIPKNLHSVDLCFEAVKQNASAIKYVSKKVMTNEICIEAVRNDGTIIAYSPYIPDEFRTKKLYLEAIKQNGKALKYVPDKYKSESLCRIATEQNGLALEFVPKNILSKELFMLAVEQNGLALEYVPSKNRSKELCNVAVNNNALALEHVPDKFKKTELCNAAIKSSWKAFLYVPESMYTINNCLEIFERILSECDDPSEISYSDRSYVRAIANRLPDDINSDINIIRLERQLQVREFKRKYFDKETHRFITIEKTCYREDDEVKEFDLFVDFYNYLDADLKNANLHDYDFKEVCLADFNIEDAYINSDVLFEQHLYDDSFYAENVKDSDCNTQLMISAENEVVEAISVLHDNDFLSGATLNDTSYKIYYISDIHLNHKLLNAFPTNATELEVKMYIRQLVKEMIDTASDKSYDDYLLIAGDISFNFEISTLFYTELVKFWSPGQIVVVLGNHELWDFNRRGVTHSNLLTFDEIILQYRDLFSSLGICFLQNDLLLSDGTIISEEQLKSINQDELKHICLKSPFVILGGLGFSGLNSKFNATQGIYRQTIISLDEDIKQTNQFKFIYNKLKSVLGNDKVIILTHTPKENWSNEEYNRNWIYVNGHTHRNDYCCDEEKTFYSDNQIGYYSTNIGLKHFKLSKVYDIFKYYPDGIHPISREQYLDFNRGVKVKVTFNRTGTIHMLKNHNVYCFILEKQNTGKIYLLNGGAINNLEHNDINYYFVRMAYYSDAIRGIFSDYNQALKSISDSIKKIGGTGTIHGCIVDIDYFNHIFLNPEDGTVTPYYALSIIDKYSYPNVKALLLDQRIDLYNNYLKLLDGESENVKLLKGEIKAGTIEISRFIPDTDMYRPSRIMKSLQYLTEVNVIRIWNDRIFESQYQSKNKAKDLYTNNNDSLSLSVRRNRSN
jgi:calcineurin-like phosphoesterase family protein